MSVWREPAAETTDYPGLYVHDGRVTGSITIGQTRLPIWAFAGVVARYGWQEAEAYEPGQYDWDAASHDEFIRHLIEHRGEFARLLCVLADVERRAFNPGSGLGTPWWQRPRSRSRVRQALQRCLDTLDDAK